MNYVVEEMLAIIEESENDIAHEGMPRRSGRYPWGSGDNPYQRTRDLLGRIEQLKKEGWSETPENIKNEFGLTTTQYRAQKSLAKSERRSLDVARAKSLKDDGLGDTEIARKMSTDDRKINESTVRSWLNEESEQRMNRARATADVIKKRIDETGMLVDIGANAERELGISKEKLNQAVELLKTEGYVVYGGGIPQITNKGQQTNLKVICPPGTEAKDFYKFTKGELNITTLKEYISKDGGETYEKKFTYPESMDPKRLKIRYAEEGGIEKDGIIELRRGVEDLSLGESRYSQVRILVDGTHYLKGMAVYSDDAKNWPEGVDVVFNTNKKQGTPALGPKTDTVLKTIKKDPENPFGSAIKDSDQGGQYWYGPEGKKKLGLINKRADEGDWTEWKDALPSQFLSKQALPMAKKQLGLAVVDKAAEYDELCSLTNPTVKKYMLNKFAEECDSAAVHLQAAALPGQKYHVIIPVPTLKDNEVYAPGYEPGSKLALIRYPHGGTFEIPIQTVNNKNQLARKIIGTDTIDAIGINHKVAERLSGADFDGDTVMCIPTHDRGGKVKITSTRPLADLDGFDSKSYGPDSVKVDSDGKEHYYRNGKEYRTMKNTGTQMGIASNLITDMTLLGADSKEIARAVKHSMVVIDAEKHHLDYKQSELDNNIPALKKAYQRRVDDDGTVHYGGASTLLSRSKGEQPVLKRQGSPVVNLPGVKVKGKDVYDPTKPDGSLLWQTADDVEYQVTKTNKRTGDTTTTTKYRTQKSTRMGEADDARSLISDANTPMENAYADYANRMKSMANTARKEMMSTGKIKFSSTAKETYKAEVSSLMGKLNTALLNSPRERYAQVRANVDVNIKKQNDPGMKPDEIKKASQQALTKNRQELGSVSRRDRSILITDREWEAIQAGAISETNLNKILANTDVDNLRQRATPRATTTLSQAKINRIKALSASNYTTGEIAKKLGVSTSTVSDYLKGGS